MVGHSLGSFSSDSDCRDLTAFDMLLMQNTMSTSSLRRVKLRSEAGFKTSAVPIKTLGSFNFFEVTPNLVPICSFDRTVNKQEVK